MTGSRPAGNGGIAAVALDLMDTVVYDPFREALHAATGMGLRELFASRDESAYPAFERGELTEAEYWSVYTDAGIDLDVDAFHRTRRAGYELLPGMAELIDDLRARLPVVAATNYPHWVDELESGLVAGLFDGVYASCRVGARKPEPRFFHGLVDRLDVPPDRLVFVDDREGNVEAARDVGLRALLYVDTPSLRRDLEQLGVLNAHH